MAGRRKDWDDLSPDYRARLERQGIDAQSHREANLLGARGHTPQAPSGRADPEATERLTTGEATERDIYDLERWAESKAVPGWIPEEWSVDMKAAASQFSIDPRNVNHIQFTPAADGEPWQVTITPKGVPIDADGTSAYDRTFEIPGGGGRDTWGAREMLDWLAYGDDWGDWYEPPEYDVGPSA